MTTKDLNDLRVYQAAMELGGDIWKLVEAWNWFPKQSMGLQLVRAADSIAANISEGYGRFSFKENARFCHFARGSLRETQTWLTKAGTRGLISNAAASELLGRTESLRRSLDNYIHSIGRSKSDSSSVDEDPIPYRITHEELPPVDEFLARLDILNFTSAPRVDSLTS